MPDMEPGCPKTRFSMPDCFQCSTGNYYLAHNEYYHQVVPKRDGLLGHSYPAGPGVSAGKHYVMGEIIDQVRHPPSIFYPICVHILILVSFLTSSMTSKNDARQT